MKLFKKHQVENLKDVFSNKNYVALGILSSLAIGFFFAYFTSLDIVKGNLGIAHAYSLIFIQALITVLFGVNMPLIFYKFNMPKAMKSKSGSLYLLQGDE